MRSTVAAGLATLTLEWADGAADELPRRHAFVEWWATKPGWRCEVKHSGDAANLAPAVEGEALYAASPDVNGRPCSPPPAGTFLAAVAPVAADPDVNGRPCDPAPTDTLPAPTQTVPAPAATPVGEQAGAAG